MRSLGILVLLFALIAAPGCQMVKFQNNSKSYVWQKEIYEMPAGFVGSLVVGALALISLPLVLAHPWTWAEYWDEESSKVLVLLNPKANYNFTAADSTKN